VKSFGCGLGWSGLPKILFSRKSSTALIGNGISFVAEVDGWGVAAFLNGEMTSDALHIWQMAVHEQQQRRGIGRRLIAAAEQSAITEGARALTLTTFRNVPWNVAILPQPRLHSSPAP